MADSENEKRPVRKLTVKNFSVIEDAELEFGKITVLIGPQASGKSLLCRLAYFFQKVVIEIAERAIREAHSLDGFKNLVCSEFADGWFESFLDGPDKFLMYKDGAFWLTLHGSTSGDYRGVLEFSPEIENAYAAVFQEQELEKKQLGNVDPKRYAQQIRNSLKEMQSPVDGEVYSYIPSTRTFFVTSQRAIAALSNRSDPFALRFSQDFSFEYRQRVPPGGLENELTHWIDGESRRILLGEVVSKENYDYFQANDGRRVPMRNLSSGTQELLPLLTCLREFVALSCAVAKALDISRTLHRRLFYVEEPEANVFPSTQYELVRIFARMVNEPALDASWVVTTHSPYILSSFNNLIEAGQAARNHPQLHDEIAKIIPEQYWIKEGDFKAYCIHDGKLQSILSESGLIDGDYLDEVSNLIGNQFDELLRLEYDQTEAS
jgi:hypothetical protein